MNETTTGLVLLAAIIVISSIIFHAMQKRFWVAVAGATILSVALFQTAVFLKLGYLDPFALIAVIMTSLISATGAVIIGVIFKTVRRWTGGSRNRIQ